MLYPLSYGRMSLVVWLTSQPRRRREDLNLRFAVNEQLISSEPHSAALARLLNLLRVPDSRQDPGTAEGTEYTGCTVEAKPPNPRPMLVT